MGTNVQTCLNRPTSPIQTRLTALSALEHFVFIKFHEAAIKMKQF